jgi:Tol biopolymer transport system component
LSFAVAKVTAGRRAWALRILLLADKTTLAFAGVTSAETIGSVFSPDGKWLAYAAGGPTTDVNRGVFVQSFPAGTAYQVPRQLVDFHPTWSASGQELVFTGAATAAQMVAIGITTAGGVKFGAPVQFPASVTGDRLSREPRAWDILPDGRFIGIVSGVDDAARSSASELRLVLNWFDELKQLVPVP